MAEATLQSFLEKAMKLELAILAMCGSWIGSFILRQAATKPEQPVRDPYLTEAWKEIAAMELDSPLPEERDATRFDPPAVPLGKPIPLQSPPFVREIRKIAWFDPKKGPVEQRIIVHRTAAGNFFRKNT